MKVALTGVHGLVGSAIISQLNAAKLNILELSRTNGFDLKRIDHAQIENFAPETFIHSAWAGANSILRNDKELLSLNYSATLRLFDIAVESGCRRFISFGSQAEYSDALAYPISENAPTKPRSAYGKTKIDLCDALQEAADKRNIEFVWLRLFTCYGNSQHAGYILPYLINSLSQGAVPEIKTPQAVWDYLHADDVAKATLILANARSANGIYNLASGVGVSVGELSMEVARIVNFPHMNRLEKEIGKKDIATYHVADIDKISNDFNWSPAVTLSEGIARMIITTPMKHT